MKPWIPPCIALLALALAGSASAEDDVKTTTGAQCRPMDGNQWSRLRISATGMTNVSELDTYVTCTLPTDGETGYSTGRLSIWFLADGTARNITCSAYSGDLVVGSNSISRSEYIAANAWDGVFFKDLQGGGSKPIGFNCKLPPKYKLITIFWAESVATSTP